jgi:DnaJ-class molecular chaperone
MSYVKTYLAKETCLACQGAGEIIDGHPHDPYAPTYTCPVCRGEGEVHPDDNMTMERYERIHRARNRPPRRLAPKVED